METIEKTIKDERIKFVCDYVPNDTSKHYTINGISRAIVIFENNLDRIGTNIGEVVANMFYHSFLITHEHLPTPYEVRK